MKNHAVARRARHAGGMTYVEVMVSVLLISVCLAPAMQSISTGLSNLLHISRSTLNGLCTTLAMEKALSDSYTNLLSAAVSASPSPGVFANPTSYSLAPDANCPVQTNVYILRYNYALSNPFAATSDDMLYVRAEIVNGGNYGTLVIRKQ